ncbi:MAG: carbon-nitrogen hydrolase family protein [Candidatus Lokiarchaeota archaeon]|nr:carbon-nitrogen hydrolase family protein [Candidatus Lokiarchaeota archaeon]
MMIEETEVSLLERAKVEEKNYNWVEAVILYDTLVKSYLDNKSAIELAEVYKKLGYAYFRAAENSEISEEFQERYKNCIKAYEEAADIYKQTEIRADELNCMANAFFYKGFIENSLVDAKNSCYKAYELFIESSEIYSKENNQESFVRTLSRAALALSLTAALTSNNNEIQQFIKKGRKIVKKAWRLSKTVGSLPSIAESLWADNLFACCETFTTDFKLDENWEVYIKELLYRVDESLKLADSCDDYRFRGLIYALVGEIYGFYGVQFVEDEIIQRKTINKGLKLLEKGLQFAKIAKDNQIILWSLFWLDWWAWLGGRYDYIQKRIVTDLNEFIKIGEIYGNSFNILIRYAFVWPALYYSNFAQRSFFTPAQRKIHAKQGIKYAKESMKIFPLSFWAPMSYQVMTWSYSQLTILAIKKDEQGKYAQKMLHYAKQAEAISKKYNGGGSRAAGYSSLYKAYKTLAEINENKEEKIKMLSTAVDASKMSIGHAVESRTGTIAAFLRLALLYEELYLISGELDSLMEAKEILLNVNKESIDRRYNSFTAASHEYIARIEDRLGNHTASAEHYKRAQKAYGKSLETIEYKPLKKRVNEKIEYAHAWNLIEKAKSYNKRESHLKAKECYEKACEILKRITRYNYEALYFSAWISQEEAEHLSKQEKHNEAIESFEKTKKIFYNAIKTLEKSFIQSKDKIEKERIKKLENIAKIRMNYCSARINLEKAKILGKKGEHIDAAEKFSSAASQIRDICTLFIIKREQEELKAVYYLCKAWEKMEFAENYLEPERYAEAADLFSKASQTFPDNKMKLLASGNCAFCNALKLGCKFDESYDSETKVKLYPNIKAMLRGAATSYEKGGFKNGADWALATSTYFDGVWYIIKADEEMELKEKERLLKLGEQILKSTADLFGKAGYEDKQNEVLNRIGLIEKEEKILFSALNSIKKPEISGSTTGIIAPACPIEISQSPRLSEVRQITDNILRRYVEEKTERKKYEIIYTDFLKQDLTIQKSQFRIGIAQIGLSKTGEIITEFFEEKSSGLLGFKKDKIKTVISNVKKMVDNAGKHKIDVLIFPEMTIDLNYIEFLEEISNLAKKYNMYIIPGSYHDQETKQNISMVISPERVLWKQEKHIPAIIHFKDKKFKEAIETTSRPRKILVCNTEYGRIAIAICRDFLDMDLRVELKNFEPAVDIILNPAFTPVTADFKAAHFDARRSIYAYCFFANVAEFGDSLIYTPEKDRTERNIPAKEEGLIYKDIDLFKLRSERKKWEKEQNRERLFIQSTR